MQMQMWMHVGGEKYDVAFGIINNAPSSVHMDCPERAMADVPIDTCSLSCK